MGEVADSGSKDLEDMLALATRDESMRRTLVANADKFCAFSDRPELELFWAVMKSWTTQYGNGDVPADHFVDVCSQKALRDFGSDENVGDYARWLCTRDVSGLSRRYLVDRLRMVCAVNADSAMRRKALSAPLSELKESMRGVDAAMAIGEIPEETNPFKNGVGKIDKLMGEQKRRPMGVPFIDISAGGGMNGGEMLLAIMPQGSGKTTLSLQACRACVERGRHVLYITFEQPLQGDLMRRLLVLASGGTRDDWAVSKLADAPPQLVERLERNAESWAKYFHFVDHWQKPDSVFRSVSAIDDMLDQYVKSDVDPYLVVIDWWGIVRMMVLAMCKLRDGQERRDFASLQLKHLAGIADKYNTRIIVFHQMGGKSAGKTKPGSMYEGQEDSNMGQFFDIAMTSDRPDKSDGTISFLFDKARMGAGGTVRQKLDGQRCMFVDPPDEAYMVSASSNISMPEDEPGSPKAMIAQ